MPNIEIPAGQVEEWVRTANHPTFIADSFLMSLREWLSSHEHLTERQLAAAERNYRTIVLGEAGGNAAYPDEATFDQVNHIHNGVYTIDNGTEHHTYQIYTPIRGPLAGKRIIKRALAGGRFMGFAFLTAEGGVRVWQRFTEDEQNNSLYIVWAKMLVARLNEQGTDTAALQSTDAGAAVTGWEQDGTRWRLSYSTVCRRCNRRLTTPTSVEAGIGPECSQRNVEETVAANPQAYVDSAASDATLARQRAEAQLRQEREAREREERAARALETLPRSAHTPEMVL